jgi:acetyl esterase
MSDHEFSRFARVRAAFERRGLGFVLGTPWLRNRLARRRSALVEGRTLDEDVAILLALDDLSNTSDLRRLSPEQARRRVAREIQVVDAPPPPGVAHEDRRIAGPAGALSIRVYVPEGLGAPSPSIVYLHGGGWVTGSIATHDGLCRRLAVIAGCRVVSVGYRLAPEHPYPAAADDALAAMRWTLENAESLGVDPARVAVAGDSAGGNLSAVVARRSRGDARRPALQVLLYPALDATCSSASYDTFAEGYFLTRPMCHWYYAHYLGDGDRRIPDVSPLLAPDVSDVPAHVYTAGFDPLRDEGLAYAERLRAAGTPVLYRECSDLVHGFVCMTGAIARARAATEQIAEGIGRALRTGVA